MLHYLLRVKTVAYQMILILKWQTQRQRVVKQDRIINVCYVNTGTILVINTGTC